MIDDLIIPAVKWPKFDGVYKVMQFEKENQPYLRFSRKDADEFHADIFERFCMETRQRFITKPVKDGKLYVFRDDGPYKLVGAGGCTFCPGIMSADFFGSSESYQLEISKGHLDRLKKLHPEWNIKII